MHCPTCATNNPDSNRFCENCGGTLGLTCTACGRENGPKAKFCGDCGNAIRPAAVDREQADRVRFANTDSPQLSGVRGELKIATVLFADIASSTEAVAHLGAEDAMYRLQPAVRQMCDAIELYGGTVVRTLGDGIMALFGAPRTIEGHVRLACEAALRIQSLFPDESQGFRVRVGLHTGQVASDPTVGVSVRSDAVHGFTVHLASRVMTSAAPGEIRITQASRDEAGDAYDFERLGAVHLKGIGEGTQLYTLVGTASNANAAPRRTNSSPLRGRARELLQLQSAMLNAEKGHASIIAISGEPGAGKSRLSAEFADWCRARGTLVHEFKAQLYGHAAPLQPILELFRKCFFNISDLDDAAAANAKIIACLEGLAYGDATTIVDDATLLADFIGLAEATGTAARSVSEARHARLLALTRQMFRRPRGKPMLVLLEDLHWLDDASLEFLDELVKATTGTQIVLLLNYRPSFVGRWDSIPIFSNLTLENLSDKVVGEIVNDLVRHPHDLVEARDLIIRRSRGNPLFAEELARSLSDELANIAVASQLASRITTFAQALPFNVQSIIGARIDRLSQADKTVLQICSVIGEKIPLAVLARIAGKETAPDLIGTLNRLRAGDFIQQRASEGIVEFSFRHPLIQEVAYEAQLKSTRSSLHHSVAIAMEDHYRDRGKGFAALIGHHYAAAGAPVKAAEHMSQAAKWIASTDASQAIKHWRQVRDLLKDQPATSEVGRLRSLAGGGVVLLGWREGLPQEEIQQIVDESLALAGEANTNLVQLLLFAQGRSLQSNGGSADEYVRCVRRALTMAPESTTSGRKALLNIALGHACAWSGLLREGIEAIDLGLANEHQIEPFDREFVGIDTFQWAYGIRARLLNRLGRFDEAFQHLGKISARAAEGSDSVMKQISHHVYIDLAWCSENRDIVGDHSAHVMEFAEKSSSAYARVFAHNCAGLAASVLGHHPQAKASFSEALARMRESKTAVEFEPEILASLAESCLFECAYDRAISHAENAVSAAVLQSNRISECRALVVLSVALIRTGQSGQVSLLLERARDLIETTGASILRAKLEHARHEWLSALTPESESGGAPTASAPSIHTH